MSGDEDDGGNDDDDDITDWDRIDMAATWELFPNYLLDYMHLSASKTLHHKTSMKREVSKLESKLANNPRMQETHQQLMHKKLIGRRREERDLHGLMMEEAEVEEMMKFKFKEVDGKEGSRSRRREKKEEKMVLDAQIDEEYEEEKKRKKQNHVGMDHWKVFRTKLIASDWKHIFNQFQSVFGSHSGGSSNVNSNSNSNNGDVDWMSVMASHHRVASYLVELCNVSSPSSSSAPVTVDNEEQEQNTNKNKDKGSNVHKHKRTLIPKSLDESGQVSYLTMTSHLHDAYTVNAHTTHRHRNKNKNRRRSRH